MMLMIYLLDAVTSSGILKAKQKLGVTFNFDKQDVIMVGKLLIQKRRHSYDISVVAVRRDHTSGVSVLKVYRPWTSLI